MDTPVNHRREVTGVVFLTFSLILAVSFYLPVSATGVLGKLVRSLGLGLFGVTAYAIPVLFFYMAIDFILEKRQNVAPKRVRSVLFLLLGISVLFPLFTIDFDSFRKLCLDPLHNTPLASKGISVLWQSGIDSDVYSKTLPTSSTVLTGGVISGGISIALEALADKTLSVVIVFAFILSQAVLIFNVSLSKTAAKTAEVIRTTTHKASDAIRTGRESLRVYSQLGLDDKNTNPHSVTSPVSKDLSPFAESSDERQGFIDLEGTQTKMNISSYRGHGNTYDLDLSAPIIDSNNENLTHLCEPIESKVETDYTALASEPIPTSKVDMQTDMPDFLREKRDAQWIDIRSSGSAHIDPSNPNTYTVQRVGTDGQFIQKSADESDNMETEEYVGGQDIVQGVKASDKANAKPLDPSLYSEVQKRVVIIPPETVASRQMRISIPRPIYKVAPASLLRPDAKDDSGRASQSSLVAQGKKLEDTLASFGVIAKVINITHGPAITRFELTPGPGIKVSRIVNLTDDLALAMASVGVRIEAPIPGKSAIGIEIPNAETSAVTLRSLLDTPAFRKTGSPLLVALGRDIPGNPILCDLSKMPHLLIAGATGSGKSVCINSILISILCKATPNQVRLIMIDPKVVELSIYNGIPHLLAPVVTDPKKAANTLNWAVGEMTRRYGFFAEAVVRDFRGYNEELARRKEPELPLILIVIDELADLMQVASKEVEESIARLTAMARAAGIHLLIATQRPSVDVITGVIKANIPSRIAFAVSSQVDSRTILDMVGAEKLLGKGDMLFYPQSAAKPQRGQGAFVSDGEVESIIEFLKSQNMGTYDPEEAEAIVSATSGNHAGSSDANSGDEDELLPQAVEIVLIAGCASVSILQRRMNIGYPRAARLIDRMQEKGYIGPFEGSKPRKLLISQSQWLEIQAKGG